jgi:hypothetical protein
MRKIFKHVFLTTLLSVCCVLGLSIFIAKSSASERPLKTEMADKADVKGSFTVIFYGGSYGDDLETLVILDSEGDEYTLEPYVPDFDLVIKKGVQAGEALKAAEKFVNFHPSFWRSQLSRVLDKTGRVIAYELRPLYLPITFGFSDVLEVNYWAKERGKVKVTIKLIPQVEKFKLPGGLGGSSGGN